MREIQKFDFARAAMLGAALAAASAGVLGAPPNVSRNPASFERAIVPKPPMLRDRRDRKRKKKLKAAKKPIGVVARIKHRRRERIVAAHIRDGFDMRHEKYLHAHARRRRRNQWAELHPSESEPKAWTARGA